MREVEVEAVINAPRETVSAHLSPESIMDYERTYEVIEIEEDGDGWLVSTFADSDTGMVVRFEERPDGYAYEKVEGGFFEELYTIVSVSEAQPPPADDQSVDADRNTSNRIRVELRSEFTFGGPFAPLIDRLAANQRR